MALAGVGREVVSTITEARRAWVDAIVNAGDDDVTIRETRKVILEAALLLEQTAEGDAMAGVLVAFDAAMKEAR